MIVDLTSDNVEALRTSRELITMRIDELDPPVKMGHGTVCYTRNLSPQYLNGMTVEIIGGNPVRGRWECKMLDAPELPNVKRAHDRFGEFPRIPEKCLQPVVT